MPDAGTTQLNVDESALAGQIDALLAGMQDSAATLAADQASAQVEQGLAESAGNGRFELAEGTIGSNGTAGVPSHGPAGATPLNTGEVESLASQIDALVAQVAATVDEGAAAAVQSPPKPGAVGSGDAEVAGGGEPATEGHGPAAAIEAGAVEGAAAREPEIDLGQLDVQLAAQAGRSEPEPKPATVAVAAVLPDRSEAGRAEVPAAVAPIAGAVTASDGAAKGAVAELAPPGPSLMKRAADVLGVVRRQARLAAALVLGLSARTLEASPKLARQTAGWIGLVTVFFACCMWAIILFFRTTPTPEVYGVPSDVLEHGEPTPQPRPRPRAAAEEPAAGGHGAPPAAAGHGAPPPAASHGAPPAGGGHGAAAPKPAGGH